MKKLKILFFTPYGGHTGSEMMLCYLLSNLDKQKFAIHLFSGNNGSLLSQFPEDITIRYSKANANFFYRVLDKVLKKFNLPGIVERQVVKLHKEFKPDLWYINTMVMPSIVNLAIKFKSKYVLHFHELLSQYTAISNKDLERAIENANITVGCSKKVCDNLKILGSKNIQLHYECVDYSRITIQNDSRLAIRKKLGISPTAFLIVMSGQRIERKGFDIFVDTAIRNKKEDFHFLWIGAGKNTGYDYFLDRNIASHQPKNITLIEPSQNDYYNFLNTADVFFLTSREDPFPLVMLEAAFLGKPLLAFDSGGCTEFISSEIGIIIEEMSANKIDEGIENMRRKFATNEFDSKTISERASVYDAKKQSKLFENWLIAAFVNQIS